MDHRIVMELAKICEQNLQWPRGIQCFLLLNSMSAIHGWMGCDILYCKEWPGQVPSNPADGHFRQTHFHLAASFPGQPG